MGDGELIWEEEFTGPGPEATPAVGMKRKARTKKMQYVGWGSRPLLEFLQSVGTDSTKPISRYDVADIVNKYVNDNKLLHPLKKKRILCDDLLRSLFGKRTFARNKIYDLLGTHFVENQVESEDDFLWSSDEDAAFEAPKKFTLERKASVKVVKPPTSEFAAVVTHNIKLIYLKKSLVQELIKDSEMFEEKIIGSIVRVKSDPNDYLQKNSHMLLQVIGLKKVTRSDDKSAEIILRVSNFMKDVHISMLSEDNFSEEECKDLHQRIKDGLLKRPTIVELEKKVQVLHKDITNHWLAKELALLQKQIDRANEKGWRRELFGYLERKQLLQTPDEQARLLREVPEVIAEEIEIEGASLELPDSIEKQDLASPKSTLNVNGVWKILKQGVGGKEAPSACVPFVDSAGVPPASALAKQNTEKGNLPGLALKKQNSEKDIQQSIVLEGEQKPLADVITENKDFQHPIILEEERKQPENIITENKDFQHPDILEERKQPTNKSVENKDFQHSVILDGKKQPPDINTKNEGRHGLNTPAEPKRTMDVPVIDLSDDEEKSDSSSDIEILDYDLESFIWNYMDPQGIVQGPFSVKTLKRWYDGSYFPSDFKVWKTGQSSKESVTLSGMLQGIFGR